MIGEISQPLAQYGYNSKHLNKTEAMQSTRDERIRSCWGLITTKALKFHQTLNPRQKANYSIEDILIDLWIAISEKDHLWNPERGTYTTFAWNLIHNELRNIFDRSTTVQLPKDSSWRVKKYKELSKNGSLTEEKAETYEAIKRVTRPIFSISARSDKDYHSNRTTENPQTHPNKSPFSTTYYSKMADLHSTAPDKILEESEKQAKLKSIIKSISDRFPKHQLTNPGNRLKIRKFLSELGITPDHLSST